MTPDQIARFLKELKSPEDLESFVKALKSQQEPRRREVCDREPVRRSFGFEIKAGSIDEKERSVRVIASTDAMDSYDEIVEQNWRLGRYKKNPVVLYGHNSVGFLGMGGDPKWTLPIGFATDVTVTNQLESTLNFVDERANPMAVMVWEGFRQGSIRAVSVGFYPHDVYREVRDEQEIYHLDDNELFEISAVPLQANPEAVALSAERAAERAWFKARSLTSKKTTVQVPAAKAAQESKMDLEQLKAEIETLKATLKAANDATNAKSTELGAKGAELTAKAAELTAALERIKALETELAAAKTAIVTAEKSATDATERAVKAETERDALDAKAQVAEVTALVGKKITPAEKDDMIELRSTNPSLFERTMKNRPDLPHTQEIVGADSSATKSHAGSNASGSKIAAKAREAAAKAESAESQS